MKQFDKDTAEEMVENTSEQANQYAREGEKRFRETAQNIEKGIKQGQEQVRRAFEQVDKRLHENPWPVVAGIALSALLVGFIMGTSRRNR
jgi:ElaB/YqjD/DUF883 family membrane-anchored ribosome-binding protein